MATIRSTHTGFAEAGGEGLSHETPTQELAQAWELDGQDFGVYQFLVAQPKHQRPVFPRAACMVHELGLQLTAMGKAERESIGVLSAYLEAFAALVLEADDRRAGRTCSLSLAERMRWTPNTNFLAGEEPW